MGEVGRRMWIAAMAATGLLGLVMGASAEVTLRLNGSTTVQKRIMEPGKEALEKATGVKIVLTGNGTGSGMEDLVKGRCDVAMASEELADAVASMKAASGMDAPAGLQPHVLAEDVIQVIVHPSNTVARLDKEQLKGLSTGRIENWTAVGGPDQPVIVVTSHSGSATRKVFQKVIMDGEPYTAGAMEVETTRKEVDTVNLFPEGIGAVSQGFVNLPGNKEKVKLVETPEIKRPLMIITKGAPSPDVQKVIDFFRGEGRKYIRD